MAKASSSKSNLLDILFFPFGLMLDFPLVPIIFVVLGILTGVYVYYWVNSDFFGTARPDYKSLLFSNNYTHVQASDGSNWAIFYETPNPSLYNGKVPHIYPIRLGLVPFLTHDILITSGDYSNPDLVSTSVFDHHFTWTASKTKSPVGAIHLIHAVPMNEAIYQQILAVKTNQTVSIGGLEILRIDAYQKTGAYLGKWEDAGCNSLLVTSVQILNQ